VTSTIPEGDRRALIIRHAVALTTQGLPGNLDRGPVAVLPLRGKAPAVPGSRGVHDAVADPRPIRTQVARWKPTGIGIAIPEWAVVIDIDPRSGGDVTLARLVAEHGPLPPTLTAMTGRGDGGRHLWWLRPPGRLTGRRLPGIDVKTDGGYVVAPPSIHPDTGRPYWWATVAPVAVMPEWLATLVTEPERVHQELPRSGGIAWGRLTGPSLVDEINASTTWHDVLDRHGWHCAKGDGDSDGSVWRHPAATSRCSATIRAGRLYVWSPNTPFVPSAPGEPRGYSRAEAIARLDHDGDLRALVAQVRETGALA
jgi:hypothetical protein